MVGVATVDMYVDGIIAATCVFLGLWRLFRCQCVQRQARSSLRHNCALGQATGEGHEDGGSMLLFRDTQISMFIG